MLGGSFTKDRMVGLSLILLSMGKDTPQELDELAVLSPCAARNTEMPISLRERLLSTVLYVDGVLA